MMKKPGVLLYLIAAAFSLHAQTNTATNAAASTATNALRPMSLSDCVEQALQQNFDVQVQRFNIQIAQDVVQGAYAGYDPLFNASGQHNYDSLPGDLFNPYSTNPIPALLYDQNAFKSGFTGLLPWGMTYNLIGQADERYGLHAALPFKFSDSLVGLTVTQPVLKNLWIDQTRLNIRVAKNLLKNTEQALRGQIINSVTAVVIAYYELIFAQQNVHVQQQSLDLARTQLDQDNQRFQIGAGPSLSIQQDNAQVAQAQANLIAAQRDLDTDQHALKNLLTDHYFEWRATNVQPTAILDAPRQNFDLEDSWRKGLAQRPDLLQAKLNAEQRGIQLKYSFNQLFPQLDLIGSYGFNGAGREFSDALGGIKTGNNPFYTYGAQLTVPVGSVGPRNQYRASKAALQQTLTVLSQLEQTVMVQIDDAVKHAQSDYESVEATRQARIYAETALVAEQQSYAAGKATTFELLTYQNNLTAARSQEIRALANYNQTLATLAQQEGATLEQHHITFEAK